MPPKVKAAKKSPKKASKETIKEALDAENESKIPQIDTPEAILSAGILPMFITSGTLKLFNIIVGETVTKENTRILISKDDLLKDIQARLSISDFQPAKQQIINYPESELALYYDPEFKYGQNFYLITSIKARGLLEKVKSENNLSSGSSTVAKEMTRWISQGSEEQINAERVIPTRSRISLQFSKRRRDYGLPCSFTDFEPETLNVDYEPYELETPAEIRILHSVAVDATPQIKNFETQTPWNRQTNFSTQYELQLMDSDEQAEILEGEEIITSLEEMIADLETALYYNEAINIYSDDYLLLGDEEITVEDGNHTNLLEYQSFTDLKYSKDKCISCIDWYSPIRGTIAISCVNVVTLDERIDNGTPIMPKSSLILIWSFHDPINPQLLLEAPEDILFFKFNPKNSNIIAGGCINGQVVLWDISAYEKVLRADKEKKSSGATNSIGNSNHEIPIVKWFCISPIEFGHKFPVTDIEWLNSCIEMPPLYEFDLTETFQQFVSSSTDGSIFMWDIRQKYKDAKTHIISPEFLGKPFLKIPIGAMDSSFDYSLTKMCFQESDIEAPVFSVANTDDKLTQAGTKSKTTKDRVLGKFYCGTEEGDVLYVDVSTEKVNDEKASFVEHIVQLHFGCVSDIQRSPFFTDIILTCGAWGINIWKEGITPAPVLSYAQPSVSLISCAWSPTRPGVFYVTRSDGRLEIWDMLDTCYGPISLQAVSPLSLSFIAVHFYPSRQHTHNQFVSVGDDAGTLHVLEVPRNLCRPAKNEKSIIRSLLDVELKRLSFCQERKKAEKLSKIPQKNDEPAAGSQNDGQSAAVEVIPAESTQAEDLIEREYTAISVDLMNILGIAIQA